jgi:hypothetical protein
MHDGAAREHAVTIEEVTDPTEIARMRAEHERFRRDIDWLKSHWPDLLPRAYGKFLAVSGQQAFLADTAEEARALARAAHPEDRGPWVQYVRPPGGPRIYAGRW